MSKNINLLILVLVTASILLIFVLQPTLVDKEKYNDIFSEDCIIHFQTSTEISSFGFRKTVGSPFSLIILPKADLKEENIKRVEISSLDASSNLETVYQQVSISQIDGGYTLRDLDLPKYNILVSVFFESSTCENKAIFKQEQFFTLRRFSA